MANVRQADHDSPAGLQRLNDSIEDSPRLNEVLEDVRGHDAVEAAQGHQHVAPLGQVIQVEAMNIVQPGPSILGIPFIKLNAHNAPHALLAL